MIVNTLTSYNISYPQDPNTLNAVLRAYQNTTWGARVTHLHHRSLKILIEKTKFNTGKKVYPTIFHLLPILIKNNRKRTITVQGFN